MLSDTVMGSKVGAKPPAWSAPLSPELVEKEAKERIKARQGDITDDKDVLGEYVLQGGKYRGQCFRWLLEHVPGYVGWFVGEILKDEGKEDMRSGNSQKKNKSALKRYVLMFEEGRELVRMKKRETTPTTTPPATPAVLSPSRFSSLLTGRALPPEVLRRRVMKLASPPKVKPNIPTQEDRELIACLDEYESTLQG